MVSAQLGQRGLQAFPELPGWAPALDRNNGDWRRGGLWFASSLGILLGFLARKQRLRKLLKVPIRTMW